MWVLFTVPWITANFVRVMKCVNYKMGVTRMKSLKEVVLKCVRCGKESRVKTALYMRMPQSERTNFRCNYCLRYSDNMEEAESTSR